VVVEENAAGAAELRPLGDEGPIWSEDLYAIIGPIHYLELAFIVHSQGMQ